MEREKELEALAREIYTLMKSKGVTWREMDLIVSRLCEQRKQIAGFDEALKRMYGLPL